MNPGEVVGIVLGVIALLLILIVLIMVILKRRPGNEGMPLHFDNPVYSRDNIEMQRSINSDSKA